MGASPLRRVLIPALAVGLALSVGCGSERSRSSGGEGAAGVAGESNADASSNGGGTNTGGVQSGTSGSGGGAGVAGSGGTPGGDSASDGSSSHLSEPPDDASTPHTVLGCDALPAVGKWESILPPGLTIGTLLMVDPFVAGQVYVASDDHGLYKSSDCGATWTHINTGANGSSLDKGSITSGVMDPITPGVMYVVPIYGSGGLWKSTDGGVSWTQLFPADSEVAKTVQYNFIDTISMDPLHHLHLVAGTHADCAAPYDPACQAETTDGGMTWHIVKIPGGGWQEGSGAFVVNDTTWLYAAANGLYLTGDNGKSFQTVDVAGGANAFGSGGVQNHGISRGHDGTYYLASFQGLVKSPDAMSWALIPNSGGRIVSLVIGGGNIYTSDQWSPTYHVASESDPSTWTTFPAPYQTPTDTGGVYLDYDPEHHILYSSNFAGGLWRVVTQ